MDVLDGFGMAKLLVVMGKNGRGNFRTNAQSPRRLPGYDLRRFQLVFTLGWTV